MSTTVSYKGNTIATVNNETKSLATSGTWLEDDITITDSSSSPSLQSKTNIDPTTSSQTITADYGYDGLSSVQINAMPSGSATTPATTITANPSITVSSGGLITATASATQSVTPTVSAGYVSSGTAGTITVSGSNTSQMTVKAATTYTPTTSNQTIASGTYLTGTQTIEGDADLVAGNIKDGVTIFGVTGTYDGGGGGSTTIDELNVTANGTYTAQTGHAYSPVLVNVTSPSSVGTLLNATSLGTLSTTSTSNVDTGKTVTVTGAGGYDLIIVETSVDTLEANKHAATIYCLWLTGSGSVLNKNGFTEVSSFMNMKTNSSKTISSRAVTTKYGVFPNSNTFNSGTLTMTMYMRYNSTQTGTINSSYTTRTYGVNLAALVGG